MTVQVQAKGERGMQGGQGKARELNGGCFLSWLCNISAAVNCTSTRTDTWAQTHRHTKRTHTPTPTCTCSSVRSSLSASAFLCCCVGLGSTARARTQSKEGTHTWTREGVGSDSSMQKPVHGVFSATHTTDVERTPPALPSAGVS